MSDDQDELFDRILCGNFVFNSPYWDSISQQAKDLITHMLLVNPEIRFSAEDVLDHSWFMVGIVWFYNCELYNDMIFYLIQFIITVY